MAIEFCGQAANMYECLNGTICIHWMLASPKFSFWIRMIRKIRS